MTGSWRKIFTPNVFLFHAQTIIEGFEISFQFDRGGSRGRVQGVRPPPEMTCGFLIQLVFCKRKKTMWFIGVEVEQETSAPPPKKSWIRHWFVYQKDLYRNDRIPSEYSKSVKDTKESGKTSKLYNLQGQGYGLLVLAPGNSLPRRRKGVVSRSPHHPPKKKGLPHRRN